MKKMSVQRYQSQIGQKAQTRFERVGDKQTPFPSLSLKARSIMIEF